MKIDLSSITSKQKQTLQRLLYCSIIINVVKTAVYRIHGINKIKQLSITYPSSIVSEYLNDNKFITSGHRKPGMNLLNCISSMFCIHNETVNIWTHGIASFYFTLVLIRELKIQKKTGNSRLPVIIPLIASINTFGISSIAHMFTHNCASTSNILFCLDKTAISTLLSSAVISAGLIHFKNKPSHRNIFVTSTVASGLSSIIAINRNLSKQMNTCIFVTQCVQGMLPLLLEYKAAHGNTNSMKQFHKLILCYLLTYGFGLLGAITYSTNIPERFIPCKFDIFGSGHQLMHIFSSIATFYVYTGLKTWMHWKY
jgi:adiponectin receptor